MMRETGVGTDADRAGRGLVLPTFSGAIVATATQTGGNADVAIVTAIGNTIGIGAATGNAKDSHS